MWLCLLFALPLTVFGRVTFVPTDVMKRQDQSIGVVFTRMDMLARSADPSLYPMFGDLVAATSTRETKTVSMDELEAYLSSTSAESGRGMFEEDESQPVGSYASLTPAGFVFHEARVGSTLVANSMLIYSSPYDAWLTLPHPRSALWFEWQSRVFRVLCSSRPSHSLLRLLK